jgi:hypothetical protein
MGPSSKPSKPFKDASSIAAVTLAIFLLVDFFAGSTLLSVARKEGNRDTFRVAHPQYHHSLQTSYEGPAYWGPFSYTVCTNASGMKSDCQSKYSAEKSFDIAFIGDSFTEGVGVPYEDSFVGMVAKAHPDLKIANLGVVSYSPTIYLKKLEEYFKQGYTFKKVIVFIDIGDIMDEAFYFTNADNNVVFAADVTPPGAIPYLKYKVRKIFPLMYEGLHHAKCGMMQTNAWFTSDTKPIPQCAQPIQTMHLIASAGTTQLSEGVPVEALLNIDLKAQEEGSKEANAQPEVASGQNPNQTVQKTVKEPSIYERDYIRSAWTYNLDASGYGDLGPRGSLVKALERMERVATLVKANNATLSVGVYPWPAQLIFDKEDSLQVQVWQKFCEKHCENFYNAFPDFFAAVKNSGTQAVIYKYFFPGDMHYSREGNALVADTILRTPLLKKNPN